MPASPTNLDPDLGGAHVIYEAADVGEGADDTQDDVIEHSTLPAAVEGATQDRLTLRMDVIDGVVIADSSVTVDDRRVHTDLLIWWALEA